MKISFSTFCLFLLFFSCTNTNNVNSYRGEVEKWLGQTMIIPDSLPVYYDKDFFCYHLTSLMRNKKSIYMETHF